MKPLFGGCLLVFIWVAYAGAYPEFQRFSKEHSKRAINCAMCHQHSDGPEGLKPGQIGSLTEEEQNKLVLARQAYDPGNKVENPALNPFGNLLLNHLGRKKLMTLKENPELLATQLPPASDLDGDGIPDAQEYLDGTHPLNSLDGRPWKLFKINLYRNWFHIAMMGLATIFGLYGLYNALLWFSMKARK